MLTVSSARLDSGYDSDLGELDSVYDSELKIFCSVSFEDYCRSTAHSLPSSTKKRGKANTSDKAEEPKCHARDFANCSHEKFVHLIESVSYKGVKYGVTSAAPSAESVPKYMDLEEQGRYALLALHSCLKRTSTLKEPRMKKPSTEDIESVLSGEYTPPTYSLFEIPGKRVAPPSPTPPEKKVCLEGTSRYKNTVSGETVSLQMTSSMATASCLPVSPSSPTVSASPSPSPSPPPPPPPVSTSPVSSSPVGASSSTQFKVGRLAGALLRLKRTFDDDEATSLRNNVGKQLVYELLSYMFFLQQPEPRVRFSTGQDTNQTGGFRGYIVFKGSSQTKLGPPQSTTGTLEYTISGIPDVVVTTSDKSKLLIVAEIKSESEPRSRGAGQLLISAVVNAVKFDCNVMGLLIHPMKVELYEVKKNGRNIEIRRVYTHEENKSSSLDLHRLQDALMFMYKFYSNNQ